MKKILLPVLAAILLGLAVVIIPIWIDEANKEPEVPPFDRTSLDNQSVFRDYVFEQRVREALDLPEGPIDTDALKTVTSLDLSYNGEKETTDDKILSLYGLSFFPALTSLDLSGNALLHGLSGIENCPELETLLLANCRLFSVGALNELTKIKVLDISGNSVSSLAFLHHMPLLEELDLGQTMLTSVKPFSTASLPNLTSLSLHSVNVSDLLYVFELSTLKTLVLANTGLDSLEGIETLTALTTLDVSRNDISDLTPLATLTELTELRAEINRISDLTPLTACKKLTILNVATNSLVNIDALAVMTQLKKLDIQNNRIILFSALDNLQLDELYTAGNRTEYVPQ